MHDITIRNEVYDAHGRQLYCRVEAFDGNVLCGYLDYSIYENEISIAMIRVKESYRRKGLAVLLYLKMIEENPEVTYIEGGLMTPEGYALGQKLKGIGVANPEILWKYKAFYGPFRRGSSWDPNAGGSGLIKVEPGRHQFIDRPGQWRDYEELGHEIGHAQLKHRRFVPVVQGKTPGFNMLLQEVQAWDWILNKAGSKRYRIEAVWNGLLSYLRSAVRGIYEHEEGQELVYDLLSKYYGEEKARKIMGREAPTWLWEEANPRRKKPKEPWRMTRIEYADSLIAEGQKLQQRAEKYRRVPTPDNWSLFTKYGEKLNEKAAYLIQRGLAQKKPGIQPIWGDLHRKLVQWALERGDKVPRRIRKSYGLNPAGLAEALPKIPFVGIVTRDGYIESYNYETGEKNDFHHSFIMSDRALTDFEVDSTLRFTLGSDHYYLEGHPAIDPNRYGQRQIRQFARYAMAHGAPADIPIYIADMKMRTAYEGRSIGTLGDWGSSRNPRGDYGLRQYFIDETGQAMYMTRIDLHLYAEKYPSAILEYLEWLLKLPGMNVKSMADPSLSLTNDQGDKIPLYHFQFKINADSQRYFLTNEVIDEILRIIDVQQMGTFKGKVTTWGWSTDEGQSWHGTEHRLEVIVYSRSSANLTEYMERTFPQAQQYYIQGRYYRKRPGDIQIEYHAEIFTDGKPPVEMR